MQHFEDSIDRAARYAQRGRRYGSVPDRELGERWAEAFRATVTQPDVESHQLAEQDLFAEHQLRRIQPPYDDVSAYRERLVAQIIAKVSELKPNELQALKRNGASRSGYGTYVACLECAETAVTTGRVRLIKQRAVVRALTRRHSSQAAMARGLLEALERSVARCEEVRDYYAGLLKRLS